MNEEQAGWETDLVRPYTLTRGRTRTSDGVHVEISAIVQQSAHSRTGHIQPPLGPVELSIWHAAADQLSSVEISARLRLPLGVVRVLIGDLVLAGMVDLGNTTSDGDVQLLRRLINGVRSL